MCWALPQAAEHAGLAAVIAPGAKNLLPDKDTVLGATGRILRGTRFCHPGPLCNSVTLSSWFVGVAAGKGAGEGVEGHHA